MKYELIKRLATLAVVLIITTCCAGHRNVLRSSVQRADDSLTVHQVDGVAVNRTIMDDTIAVDSTACGLVFVDSSYVDEQHSDTLIVRDSTYVYATEDYRLEQQFHFETRILRDVILRDRKVESHEWEERFRLLQARYVLMLDSLAVSRDSVAMTHSEYNDQQHKEVVVKEKPWWRNGWMWACIALLLVLSARGFVKLVNQLDYYVSQL